MSLEALGRTPFRGQGRGKFGNHCLKLPVTCLAKVSARIPGVVVNLRKAGLGGSSQPNRSLKSGWLPLGSMSSTTQNMARLCRSKYSRMGTSSSCGRPRSISSSTYLYHHGLYLHRKKQDENVKPKRIGYKGMKLVLRVVNE